MSGNDHDGKVAAAPANAARWSTLAIVGFVLSFVVSVLGLVFSILGLRQTTRTGRRGLGLAAAGVVISSVELVLTAVIAVMFLLGNPVPLLADELAAPPRGAAHFGVADRVPAISGPRGVHQSLVAQGWTPRANTSSSTFIDAHAVSSLESVEEPTLAFEDPTGACTVGVDFWDGTGYSEVDVTRYEISHSALLGFTAPDDGTRQPTGTVTIASAPVFSASDDAAQGPSGTYQVVQSSFSNANAPDRPAVARAREFQTGKNSFVDIVTSATCTNAQTLRSIGIPALEDSVGAAW